jgi:purine nucleoside phosphorylase
MNQKECLKRTEGIQRIIKNGMGEPEGDMDGVVAGTGCKQGLEQNLEVEGCIDYKQFEELMLTGGDLEGHSKDLVWGTVNGKKVVKISRVHNYEDTDPAVRLSTRMVIDALRPYLGRLIITNGVGTLHGPLKDPRGELVAAANQEDIDRAAAARRIREREEIGVRDIGVVDGFESMHLGSYTPLIGPEFNDFDHDGYQAAYGTYIQFARQIVESVTGRAPRALYAFLAGPQFESRSTKLNLRAAGADVVGMSGTEGMFAALRGIPFIHLFLATNGAFAPHSHTGNTEIGVEMAPTLAEILKLAVTRPWVVTK